MPQTEEEELSVLRSTIDALDYNIHDLLNERAKLALKVSEIKIKHHGVNTNFHRPEREKVIVEKVKAYNKGPLDENAIANIFEKIIHCCRELQVNTHQTNHHCIQQTALKSVGILGQGRFGLLLKKLLTPHFDVSTYDKQQNNPQQLALTLQQETLFIATPIRHFEQVISEIATKLNNKALIIDTCSVKSHPAEIMQRLLPQHVDIIASHPLFGPDSYDSERKKIVFSKIRDQYQRYQQWQHFFEQQNISVIEMSPQQHDEMMAHSQGITHLIGRMLNSINARSTPVDTAGYQQLLTLMKHTCNDSQELFYDLQRYNTYANKNNQQLLTALQDILQHIEDKP